MASDRGIARILAVKLADLGDLLLCEPALRSLRMGYPDARIDVLVPPASAALVPLLDPALVPLAFPKHAFDSVLRLARPDRLARALGLAMTLRRGHFDMLVLLHHLTTPAGAVKFRALARATAASTIIGLDNGRGTFLTRHVADLGFGARHEVEYMLRVALAAGGESVDPQPRIARRAESTSEHPGLQRPYAVLFPVTGAYSTAREWPIDRYATVASWLAQRGLQPVIAGAADARMAAQALNDLVPQALDLAGRTSLPALIALLSRAEVVVGGDSFIGHLAAALDRPTVSIFGPSNADAWRPFGATEFGPGKAIGTRQLVVRHRLPCQPCLYTGFSLGRPHGCPQRTCLRLVQVDDVTAAVASVLEAA
jgi:ADP-heptose:LPS heptosyltransferase